MAASNSVLEELHGLVAQAFIAKVQTRTIESVGKDGEVREVTVEPTAAELAAAVTFLKANNITAAPEEGGALDELTRLVEARKSRRRSHVLPDLDDGNPLAH